MDAKRYLEQLGRYEKKIRRKKAELDNWREMATSMGISYEERVQTSPKDKISAIVTNIVDAEADLNNTIQVYSAMRKRIVDTIDRIDNPLEYDIAYKHYVELKSLKEIAYEMDRSYDYVRHLHPVMLKTMDFLLNDTR